MEPEWVTRRRNNKKKKQKKIKQFKTKEDRQTWADIFKNDMKNKYGLYPGCSGSGAIIDLCNIIDEYIESGTHKEGKIDFFDAPLGGREIFYMLSNSKEKENIVHLRVKK